MPRSDPRTSRTARIARLTPLLLAALPAAPAFADTWAAVSSGTFSDNAKWADGTAPLAADSAIFSPAGSYTVTFASSPTTTSLSVSAGSVTFQSVTSNRTHTVTGNATFSGATTNLTLAAPTTSLALNINGSITSNVNAFNINAGNDVTAGASLTMASTNNTALTVSGSGSSLTVAGSTTIGQNGNDGTLTFTNSSSASLATVNIAVSGVAESGGTLSVLNGATVSTGTIAIATGSGNNQTGLLEVNSITSTLTQTGASSLTVGSTTVSPSEGRINVNAGFFNTGTGTTTVNPTGVISLDTGTFNANGNLTINGGLFEENAGSGSALNLAAGTTLTVQSAGTLTLDQLSLFPGTNATITGSGSTANVLNLDVGGSSGASSIVTVGAGALLSAGSTFVDPTGTINLTGGSLAASVTFNVAGTFSQTGGTFSVAAGRTFSVGNNGQASFATAYAVNNNNLSVSTGGDITFASTLSIGTAAGTGAATVSGAGSTLTALSSTNIGTNGFDGSLTLIGNAAASLSNTLNVGTSGTNSEGLVSVLSSSTLTTIASINLGNGTANNTGTLTVAGALSSVIQTAGNTNVGSPNPTSLGSGTLNILDGGSFSTTGTVVLNPTGTINITDGSATFNFFTNFGGNFNFNSGSLTFGQGIVIGPDQTFGTSLTLGPTRTLATQAGLQIDPNSVLTLDGGTLTVATTFTNNGTFLFNSGRLNLTSASLNTSVLPAATTLGPNRTLAVSGTLTVPAGAQLTLDGAAVTASTLSNAGNTSVNAGSLTAPTLANTGTLAHYNGVLTFSSPSTNAAGASFVIGPSATTTFNSTLANSGEIYLAGALATLAGNSTLTNSGLIRGDGRIAKNLTNSSTGELRAESGKRLKVDFLLGPNAGKITLLGGTAEFASALTSTGTITGRGTLIAPFLTNQGSIALSAGFSDVFASLTNASASKVILSGNATATFYNPVINQPGSEFRVSAGSTAVFFAPVTGAGLFTGTGTKSFESGASAPSFLATNGHTIVEPPASLTTAYLTESSLTSYGPTTLLPNSPQSTLATLDLSTTGTLDLANNTLLLTAGAPDAHLGLPSIRQYLSTSQLFSSTPDPTDTHSLGYLQSPSGLLIKLTLTGDANLNGELDPDDFALLDRSLAVSRTNALWTDGDFNYDGIINHQDYLLLDTTYLQAHGLESVGSFLSHRQSQFGADYVSTLLTNIPEPTLALSSILYPLSSLLFKRRRP